MPSDLMKNIMNSKDDEFLGELVDTGAFVRFIEGYAIVAGRKTGLTEKQIIDLVRTIAASCQDTPAAEALNAQQKLVFSENYTW